MAKPNRLKALVEQGIDLEKEIPRLVNEMGQDGAARQLGVSQFTISTWLKANGYQMRIVYEKGQGAA